LDGESASTYTGQHKTEKRGHRSVPREEFELKVPMFERSKATEALDLVSSGIGFPLSDTICLRNHTINWPFTCIILTVTDFDYVKFIRHNLNVFHHCHVCNC